MERTEKMAGAEELYLKAERELKNKNRQLSVLYSYMSDFYRHSGKKQKALLYAKKALEIDSQIYRFDHHYVRYTTEKVTRLEEEQEKESD
jgi:tetratricopeptide (TPR) repeat protein